MSLYTHYQVSYQVKATGTACNLITIMDKMENG